MFSTIVLNELLDTGLTGNAATIVPGKSKPFCLKLADLKER